MASPDLLSSAAILAFSLLLLFLFNKRPTGTFPFKKLNLPPGPPGWPLVGNLFQVAFSGKQFIHYVNDLIPVYGPILTLKMGARTMIIISNSEIVHEALVENGHQFASRPAENATRTIFSSNKFTVNSAIYGAEWRALRRNMVSGVLSSARLREFQPARRVAMDRFIDHIRAEAAANDGGVWVLRNARFAVFCFLIHMCFGVDLNEEAVGRVDAVMKKVLITVTPRMDDFLPLLRPFFSKQRREALAVRCEQMETIIPLIEKRRETLRNPTAHPEAAPFSYLDTLFDLNVEGRSPTDSEIVTLCSEFLNGGTDTTATAIEWGVARLIENPRMQARIYEEIEAAMDRNGRNPVNERDTESMEYLQAFVKELLRKHPPTYFSLTHAPVKEGLKLAGYDVPANASLEIYLPSLSEDPRMWKDPAVFDPERFLTGGEKADITGVTVIKMIPFGAGRRICPGLAMGMTNVTLLLARMVQSFEWGPHPDQPKLDFSSKLEFTVVMSRSLRAIVRPRNN
ncbi:hypothetical protein HPP92_022708 [Vanilla planifolia]|uniref:Cytochrome P450 n=1 Tax=Vanilla planifolia TaxID=51239 RepID=A0A835UFX7_VANPL|nr:hypothetical protein HPP92_023004 [Vanilla planifolia]KAG0459580.1 hypothetical protein HPP92_022708 [Vanilla planifolia]